MYRTYRLLVMLSAFTLLQVTSGYTDVFTHRFLFPDFDPPLNPAHISLYISSLLGLFVILRLAGEVKGGYDGAGRLGGRIALLGGTSELLSGLLNEVYHQFISQFLEAKLLDLSIHALFVISILLVAIGGLVFCASNSLIGSAGPIILLFLSSIWLLGIGSAIYLSFLAEDHTEVLLTSSSSLVAATIAVPSLELLAKRRPIVWAASIFTLVNSSLIYAFAGTLYALPLPVIGALLIETLYRTSKGVRFYGLSGPVVGFSSPLLTYPYSLPVLTLDTNLVASLIYGVLTAYLGAWLGRAIKGALTRLVLASNG